MTRLTYKVGSVIAILALPLTMGAQGDGCSANSRSPAPDVVGDWDITYDDMIDVQITIGGAVYNETLSAAGGSVTIEHEGNPLTFNLDCSRPEVLCPSEAWPGTVEIEQRNERFEHRMIVTLPHQSCNGQLVTPAPDECGADTLNPDCEQVCDGEMTVSERETFGVIGETGESFRLYLGAGVATNGVNCALLAFSLADADLVTTGTAEDGDWTSDEMVNGLVTIGYAGGCLWAGDPDADGELEALVLGAEIRFMTGFTGNKQ